MNTGTTWGYCRVSTTDQNTDLQADALAKAGVPVASTLSDHGMSGKNTERPALKRLLSSVKRGDTVVVYSLSRLSRSTRDLCAMVDTFAEAGVTLRSLTESLDTGTPMGRAMIGMLGVLAQLEREQIVERTTAGISAARARGVKMGRPSTVAPAVADALRVAVASGENTTSAARRLGITRAAARRVLDSRAQA